MSDTRQIMIAIGDQPSPITAILLSFLEFIMSAQLLVYGTYPILLDTHRLILERSGYRIFTARSLRQAKEVAERERIDLFILCSSLTPLDCDEAVAMLSVVQPGTRHMLLDPAFRPYRGEPWNKHARSVGGPEVLLDRIRSAVDYGFGSPLGVPESCDFLHHHGRYDS
jgi:hypothetical protein